MIELLETELVELGATPSLLFGARALNFDGTAFVCEKRGFLGAKLGAGTAEHAAALELTGAELFDPSGSGRPFRDWVAVPATEVESARIIAHQAFERARAGT